MGILKMLEECVYDVRKLAAESDKNIKEKKRLNNVIITKLEYIEKELTDIKNNVMSYDIRKDIYKMI
jgi:hypothetical protein